MAVVTVGSAALDEAVESPCPAAPLSLAMAGGVVGASRNPAQQDSSNWVYEDSSCSSSSLRSALPPLPPPPSLSSSSSSSADLQIHVPARSDLKLFGVCMKHRSPPPPPPLPLPPPAIVSVPLNFPNHLSRPAHHHHSHHHDVGAPHHPTQDNNRLNLLGTSPTTPSTLAPTAPSTTMDTTTTPIYECHFCPRKFSSFQAFGGHQNAHKKERSIIQKKASSSSSSSNPSLRVINSHKCKKLPRRTQHWHSKQERFVVTTAKSAMPCTKDPRLDAMFNVNVLSEMLRSNHVMETHDDHLEQNQGDQHFILDSSKPSEGTVSLTKLSTKRVSSPLPIKPVSGCMYINDPPSQAANNSSMPTPIQSSTLTFHSIDSQRSANSLLQYTLPYTTLPIKARPLSYDRNPFFPETLEGVVLSNGGCVMTKCDTSPPLNLHLSL